MKFRLYHYWRSSASWRVRWALNVKKLDVEYIPVSLLDGESESEEHRRRNPLGYVPVLEQLGTQKPYMIESLPIMEWLEETFPTPSLYPQDTDTKLRARSLAEIINSGTQPIINLSVQNHFSSDPAEQKKWAQHWIHNGLQAYETLVQQTVGQFSIGDQITVADLCLIPQCYGALRNGLKLEEYPTIARIYTAARKTAPCKAAEPEAYEPPKT